MIRKYKRSIEKNYNKHLQFIMQCYTTLPGSLAICNYAFLDEKDRPKQSKINQKMLDLVCGIGKIPDFNDPKYIDKTLDYFGMKRAANLSIALVIGKYNSLFTFFDGENIFPLREDGIMSRTLADKDSKIIPIKFD